MRKGSDRNKSSFSSSLSLASSSTVTSQHTNSKYDIASDAATTTGRPVGLRSQQEKRSPKVATAAVGEPGETWGSRLW